MATFNWEWLYRKVTVLSMMTNGFLKSQTTIGLLVNKNLIVGFLVVVFCESKTPLIICLLSNNQSERVVIFSDYKLIIPLKLNFKGLWVSMVVKWPKGGPN